MSRINASFRRLLSTAHEPGPAQGSGEMSVVVDGSGIEESLARARLFRCAYRRVCEADQPARRLEGDDHA
jgi:hypothetical protein